MPTSTIYVNSNSAPVSGAKVMLSFSTSGVSDVAYTNRDGAATISHTASGTATIFVNGAKRGNVRAPGTTSVER